MRTSGKRRPGPAKKPGTRKLNMLLAPLLLLACFAGLLTGAGTSERSRAREAAIARARTTSTKPVYGMCFSPYVHYPPTAPGLSRGTVEMMLRMMKPFTRRIRTFSSLGDAATAARAARKMGFKVAAGADLGRDQAHNRKQIDGLKELARQGTIDLAVVGEENLYFHFVSEAELLGYMREVKQSLVPVTTSETWREIVSHPAVAAECDVILANAFPYWEKVPIDNSVPYLEAVFAKLKEIAGTRDVILETGWPSEGQDIGPAVANPENAARYLRLFRSWAARYKVKYFYFEAFDEPWKAAVEGPAGANWGLWTSDLQPKPSSFAILKPLPPFTFRGW